MRNHSLTSSVGHSKARGFTFGVIPARFQSLRGMDEVRDSTHTLIFGNCAQSCSNTFAAFFFNIFFVIKAIIIKGDQVLCIRRFVPPPSGLRPPIKGSQATEQRTSLDPPIVKAVPSSHAYRTAAKCDHRFAPLRVLWHLSNWFTWALNCSLKTGSDLSFWQ